MDVLDSIYLLFGERLIKKGILVSPKILAHRQKGMFLNVENCSKKASPLRDNEKGERLIKKVTKKRKRKEKAKLFFC